MNKKIRFKYKGNGFVFDLILILLDSLFSSINVLISFSPEPQPISNSFKLILLLKSLKALRVCDDLFDFQILLLKQNLSFSYQFKLNFFTFNISTLSNGL